MRQLFSLLAATSLMIVLCLPANAQITGLKSRIPTDANAVVIIDAGKLFGSPAAEQNRWEARRKAAFDAGVTYLSPNTTGVVLAAKIDLEYGRNIWELAQVRLREPASIASIAARFGGSVDTIATRSAVRLPNDSIVVQVTDERLASYTPANRQEVSRWLSSTDSRAVDDTLSPYISQAFAYVEKVGTPIILAVDLSGAIAPAQIESRLPQSPAADFSDDRKAAIVKTLASIQGAMLGVSVTDRVTGSIRVDFAENVTPLKDVGRQMLLNVLERQGAMIEDFADWDLRYTDNSMFLKGTLSESGLKRVLSVLSLPPSLGRAMDEMKLTADDPESLKRIASQQYFNSVTGLLDDLQDTRRKSNSVTAGGVAMWYQKYARKIDHLPILNVDEELLDYGRDISTLLRGGETALKGVGMRSAVRTGQNQNSGGGYTPYYGDGYSGGYGYGYGGYRAGYGYGGGYVMGGDARPGMVSGANLANREKGRSDALIRQQERVRGAASAQQMWQAIDAQTAEIRRAMTEKYEVEF